MRFFIANLFAWSIFCSGVANADDSSAFHENPFAHVPFEQSMAVNQWFRPNLVQKDYRWKALAAIYSQYQQQPSMKITNTLFQRYFTLYG